MPKAHWVMLHREMPTSTSSGVLHTRSLVNLGDFQPPSHAEAGMISNLGEDGSLRITQLVGRIGASVRVFHRGLRTQLSYTKRMESCKVPGCDTLP